MQIWTLDIKAHLSQEAVHEHLFDLAEAVHPVYALHVVRRVPRGVEDDDPVGGDQVDAQGAGFGRDEEQSAP